jgi:hypothetical protein
LQFQQHAADNSFFIHVYNTQILLLMHTDPGRPLLLFMFNRLMPPALSQAAKFLPQLLRLFSRRAKENFCTTERKGNLWTNCYQKDPPMIV